MFRVQSRHYGCITRLGKFAIVAKATFLAYSNGSTGNTKYCYYITRKFVPFMDFKKQNGKAFSFIFKSHDNLGKQPNTNSLPTLPM